MTETQARHAANIVMAAAALGAAVFVMRTPKLRRLAWQLARQYAAGPLAAWTATTVRPAWDDSARGGSLPAGGMVRRGVAAEAMVGRAPAAEA